MYFLSSILFGMGGGLIRGLVGLLKFFEKNKKLGKFKIRYIIISLLVAGLVGGVGGALINGDWRLALVIGYAGTDFLENLYKIKRAQGFEI